MSVKEKNNKGKKLGSKDQAVWTSLQQGARWLEIHSAVQIFVGVTDSRKEVTLHNLLSKEQIGFTSVLYNCISPSRNHEKFALKIFLNRVAMF